MPDWIEWCRFLSIYCAGICAGGWVLVLVAIAPAKRRFPPGPAVQLHQVTSEMIDRYLPVCTGIAILTGILILSLHATATTASTISTAVAVAALLIAAVVSLVWNIRTNRKIAQWSTDDVPADYREIQQRWDNTHAIRTLCGLVALAGYILAVLAR